MNRRAKFDAASFILDGEIRNRRNKQTNKNTQTIYPHLAYRHVWIKSTTKTDQSISERQLSTSSSTSRCLGCESM